MTSAISLQRGANVALRGERGAVARIQVALSWQPRGDLEIDASAFLLTASGKVRDDHDMVFYNNVRSREGAVQLLEGAAAGGDGAHDYGTVGAEDYRDFVPAMQRRYPLEGGTNYGKVIALIRRHYRRDLQAGQQPVYVMFVTDGETQDRTESERQIRDASHEPIFWQFMALGKSKAQAKGFFRRLLASDFQFLTYLDEMPGRLIDNANFFQVADPNEPSDEELYDLLMGEYPQWLAAARQRGLLR